jgi:hypothetical protein
LGVKKAVLRARKGYILGSYPVISVGWLGPTPILMGDWCSKDRNEENISAMVEMSVTQFQK